MNELTYDCPKSKVMLGAWFLLGFIAIIALKGAITNYMLAKDSLFIFFIALSIAGCIFVGYMVRTYFKYKSVTLTIAVHGNDLSITNKDENGNSIQEVHIELDMIHRTWLLKARAGYRLVIVLSNSTASEKRISLVPSQMYEIEENEATAILSFIHHHNESVKIGYM